MISCSKCGIQNYDNAKFCQHCGNPLVIQQKIFPNENYQSGLTQNDQVPINGDGFQYNQYQEQYPYNYYGNTYNPKKKFPGWGIALIIIGGVVVLAMMVTLFLGLFSFQKITSYTTSFKEEYSIDSLFSNEFTELMEDAIEDANDGDMMDLAMKFDVYANSTKSDLKNELAPYLVDENTKITACYNALLSYFNSHLVSGNLTLKADEVSFMYSGIVNITEKTDTYALGTMKVYIYDQNYVAQELEIEVKFILINGSWYLNY